MYCSNCGVENNKENKFCYSCGNQLIKTSVKETSGNNETSLVLGIICLVTSFILNIICFIPGIISIIYAKRYKKESGKWGVGFGLSIGGMIYSVVMLILCILLFMFIFNVANEATYDDPYVENISSQYNNLPSV